MAGLSVPGWVAVSAPVASIISTGTLGVLWTILIVANVSLPRKSPDLVFFAVAILLLAPACAVIQNYFVRPNFQHPYSRLFEAINHWAASAALFGLSAVLFFAWMAGVIVGVWVSWSKWTIAALLLLHVAAMCWHF